MLDMKQLNERWELHDLVRAYAQACDRRDDELFATVLTEDAEITGPGFAFSGPDTGSQITARLGEVFERTMHNVFNSRVEVDGDCATGEVYCTATHIIAAQGEEQKLDWGIRYQDQYRRVQGVWQISSRNLIVEWTQTSKLDG